MFTKILIAEDYESSNISVQRALELISTVREIQPDLKIIVFSVEKKEVIIEKLFTDQQINAYVKKGREDVKDLKKAIRAVFNSEKYLSYDLKTFSPERNSFEFSEFDTLLVSLLANGILLKNIPDYLKKHNIRPSSMSAVEKRLKDIKETLEVNSNEQLIAFCKDFGVI